MKRMTRNDVILRVEKEYPVEQRGRVLEILEQFVQENQYRIHELILDRAHGSMEEVGKLAKIARAYAFDPRDRWELFDDPDRVFREGLHWANDAQPATAEEISTQEAPPGEPEPETAARSTSGKPGSKTGLWIFLLLILSGYFFAKNMTAISVGCEKIPGGSSGGQITCSQAYQVFGLKFGKLTYTDVTGARLDSYTEHQPGKGWYTYYRVALNTTQAEFFLTDGSLVREPEEKTVDEINHFIQDAGQTNLATRHFLESDWTYFFIAVVAMGYFIWDFWRKRTQG